MIPMYEWNDGRTHYMKFIKKDLLRHAKNKTKNVFDLHCEFDVTIEIELSKTIENSN